MQRTGMYYCSILAVTALQWLSLLGGKLNIVEADPSFPSGLEQHSVQAPTPVFPPGQGWHSTEAPTPKPGTPKPTPKPTPFPPKAASPFGNGLWGANRMFTAPLGCGKLAGTFTEPDFHVGGIVPGDQVRGVSGANPHVNQPTFFYCMQGSRVTLDAGMQWEEFPSSLSDGAPGYIKRGWSVFMLLHSKYAWPKADFYQETATGIDHGQLGNVNMELEVLDVIPQAQTTSPDYEGHIILKASSDNGGFAKRDFSIGPIQPYWDRGSPSNSRSLQGKVLGINQWLMFRTVGITQIGDDPEDQQRNFKGCFYDGSYARAFAFSNGIAEQVSQDNTGLHTNSFPQGPWLQGSWPYTTATIPNHNARNPTWYRPNAKDHKNADKTWPWPINFNPPSYNLNLNGSDKALSSSIQKNRAVAESVDVNLLPGPTFTKAVGVAIRPAKKKK